MYDRWAFYNFHLENLQFLQKFRSLFFKCIYNKIAWELPFPTFPQKVAMNNGLYHGLLVGYSFKLDECSDNAIKFPY